MLFRTLALQGVCIFWKHYINCIGEIRVHLSSSDDAEFKLYLLRLFKLDVLQLAQDHAMSNESNVALVKWILSPDNYFVFLEINAYIAVWLWSLMMVRSVPQDVEMALANCVIWKSERVLQEISSVNYCLLDDRLIIFFVASSCFLLLKCQCRLTLAR